MSIGSNYYGRAFKQFTGVLKMFLKACLDALETASVDQDIVLLTRFIGQLVESGT